jgi:SAM-dependent methyltransferase
MPDRQPLYIGINHKPWVYDLRAWLRGTGRHFDRLVTLAGIKPGQIVLDIGCGTGNLTMRAARAAGSDGPEPIVTGIDPDEGALTRASRKSMRRGLTIAYRPGYADHLPAGDASVDHIISSLALHHIPLKEKIVMAREIVRALRPGGTVTILDFAGDHEHAHGPTHPAGPGGRPFHRHDDHTLHVADNADHGVESLLASAGLLDAREIGSTTISGRTVTYTQARKP